jgi:hypothetical protein
MAIHRTARFTVRNGSSSDAVKAFTSVLYPACVAEPAFDRWLEVT